VVKENYKRFACTKCDFSITKIPGSRQLEVTEAEQLLTERTVGPLQGFRSKLGRPFAAILKLTGEHKLEFDFGNAQNEEDGGGEPVDFSDQTSQGTCPKCASQVFEHGMNYVCEKSVGPERSCDFRTGKVILQQAIEPAQMKKLLADGRTDLLADFVSSRTRRKFKAFLALQPGGKVGFEFQPRPAREGADKAPAKPSADRAQGKSAEKSATKSADEAAVKAAVRTAGKATGKAPAKAAARGKAAATAVKAPAKKPAAGKTAAGKKTAASGKAAPTKKRA
jgi:DNA topoisomerase-3